MQAIIFSETKQLVRNFIQAHNEAIPIVEDSTGRKTRDRKLKLGAAHLKCIISIIEIFSAQLNKMAIASLRGEIPNVYTSNGQLSAMIKSSPRSVQRYITRLTKAGLITGKTFHGSTHAYELKINPVIIHLAPVLNVAYIRNLERQATEAELQEAATSCLDTETQKFNNKLSNAVEMCESPQHNANAHISAPLNVFSKSRETAETVPNAGKRNGEPKPIFGGGSSPSFPPSKQLIEWAVLLWNYTLRMLYKRADFISEDQKKFALNYFIFQLSTVQDTSAQKSIFNELRERIDEAARWVNKDSARYVPIPKKYFDLGNEKGFAATKLWRLNRIKKGQTITEDYKTFQVAQAEAEIFSRYMNKFLREPDFESYRKTENFFAKNRPEMLPAFYKIVVEDKQGLNRLNEILKIQKIPA